MFVISKSNFRGSYVLIITLEKKVLLPRCFKQFIKPGIYAYCGNAFGHGGILSRCRRHFKLKKKKRWHVDWLTNKRKDLKAFAFKSLNECQIIREILKIEETKVPIVGFGSTDCKACLSHLINLPPFFSINSIKAKHTTVTMNDKND